MKENKKKGAIKTFINWINGIDWILVIGVVVTVSFLCIFTMVLCRHITRSRHNRLHKLFTEKEDTPDLCQLIPRDHPIPLLIRDMNKESGESVVCVITKHLTFEEYNVIYLALFREVNSRRPATCGNVNHWCKYCLHITSYIFDAMKRDLKPSDLIPNYDEEDAPTEAIIDAVLFSDDANQLFFDHIFGVGVVSIPEDIIIHPGDSLKGTNVLKEYKDTIKPVTVMKV